MEFAQDILSTYQLSLQNKTTRDNIRHLSANLDVGVEHRLIDPGDIAKRAK